MLTDKLCEIIQFSLTARDEYNPKPRLGKLECELTPYPVSCTCDN